MKNDNNCYVENSKSVYTNRLCRCRQDNNLTKDISHTDKDIVKLIVDLQEWFSDPLYPDIDRGTRMRKLKERVEKTFNSICSCKIHEGSGTNEGSCCSSKEE